MEKILKGVTTFVLFLTKERNEVVVGPVYTLIMSKNQTPSMSH